MTTQGSYRPMAEPKRANTAGLWVAVLGILIYNVGVYLNWIKDFEGSPDGDFQGYEVDNLIPWIGFLGLGLAFALIYAMGRAYRRQHRGLTLVTMAVGLGTFLLCVAWALFPDQPGFATFGTEIERDIGVFVSLLGSILWPIGAGLLAKEPTDGPEEDEIEEGRQRRSTETVVEPRRTTEVREPRHVETGTRRTTGRVESRNVDRDRDVETRGATDPNRDRDRDRDRP